MVQLPFSVKFGVSLLILLLTGVTTSESKKILFYFGVSTYSHRIVAWPLVEELAKTHNVSFFTPFEAKKEHENVNVTEVIPKSLHDVMSQSLGANSDLIKLRLEGTHRNLWYGVRDLGASICELLMEDPEHVSWIKSSKFDLVVIDGLNNECGLGIAHYHKTTFMIFDTSTVFQWQYDMFGFSAETSWISDLSIGYPQEMSFGQRFMNTLGHLGWYYGKVFLQYPRIEAAINKGLNLQGADRFSIREAELKTSLVLLNTHYSLEYARSIPPIFVPIGGMHVVSSVGSLPSNIKKFIDDSGDEGFIYVSFGTGAQISKAPLDLQRQFFYAFGNSSVRFIWKWEGKTVPEEMPKNVLTAQWMPQSSILAHPKIRGFMTHGGLLSIMEATTHGVPLIVLPVFAEQDYNAGRAHDIGYGIKLEFRELKQEQIQTAVKGILQNPRYRGKMHEISRIFKDRQSDPLATAVWWTEYVLRHKSTPFLMPKGVHQYWFTRRLLDVWGSIIGSIFLVLGIIIGYSLKQRASHSLSSAKLKTKSS